MKYLKVTYNIHADCKQERIMTEKKIPKNL